MLNRFICLAVCLFGCRCDRVVPAPPPQPQSNFNWDLSQDNRIERVGWPAEIKNEIWFIDGPSVVRLRIRGGIEHDVTFTSAQVWREGPRVKTIRLFRDIGTLETVYRDAMTLAVDWKIADTKDFDTFRATKAIGLERGNISLYRARGSTELIQGRSIEIRKSFNSASGKPYLALLAMGFPDYEAATTQASP